MFYQRYQFTVFLVCDMLAGDPVAVVQAADASTTDPCIRLSVAPAGGDIAPLLPQAIKLSADANTPVTVTSKKFTELERQCSVILREASVAPVRREWMQRRDILQTEYDAAKAENNYALCAKLGKQRLLLDEQLVHIDLSAESFETLALRHQQLLCTLEKECQGALSAEDFNSLEVLSQLLESMQAVDAASLAFPAASMNGAPIFKS